MNNINEITFELFGATYTRKANGYCYAQCNGETSKTSRISKAEFEARYAEYAAMDMTLTEIESEEIAEATDEAAENPEISAEQFCGMVEKMNREQNERNEFTNISKEDVVDAILSEAAEDTDLQKPAVINQYGCVDCSKCNVQNCVHRNCMRRNPTSVGGLGECPRLEVKGQETPKKKRARKSKDIAYDGNGVTLTTKQVDFIRHLPDTNFWENGLDSAVWTDVLADEIGGQFAGKPMTTGAMISTICEKGLANRATDRVNGRKATFMELTELGKKVAAELGLN